MNFADADFINRHHPEHVHIATEGLLGLHAWRHCEAERLALATSYHTRFPKYVAARVPLLTDVHTELSYAYLCWFHGGVAATFVPTKSVAEDLSALRLFLHNVLSELLKHYSA